MFQFVMSKMLELVKQVNNQPRDVAGNTMQSDAIEVVPAPRLELELRYYSPASLFTLTSRHRVVVA